MSNLRANQEGIEEPEDSGVLPEQRRANPEEAAALIRVGSPEGGLSQYPVSDAIRDISGGVRGQSGMVLLVASTRILENQLSELRADCREAMRSSDEWQQKYQNEKQQALVLGERLVQFKSAHRVRQIVGTLGGIVAGVAVPFALAQQLSGAAIGASVLALLLLIISWLPIGQRGGGM